MHLGYNVKTANNTMPSIVNKEVGKRRALELRMTKGPDGKARSYDQIAEELGVVPMTACRWVTEALTEVRYDNRERAHELRVINTRRLETAIVKVMAKIEDDTAKAADYNVLIRLIQTENKLWGLDEPSALEVTVKVEDMSTEDKMKRVSQLMEQAYQRRLAIANGMPVDNREIEWKVLEPGAPTPDNIVDGELVNSASKSNGKPKSNGKGAVS